VAYLGMLIIFPARRFYFSSILSPLELRPPIDVKSVYHHLYLWIFCSSPRPDQL